MWDDHRRCQDGVCQQLQQQQQHKGVRRPSPRVWINRARDGWMARWQRTWLTTDAARMQLQPAECCKFRFQAESRGNKVTGLPIIDIDCGCFFLLGNLVHKEQWSPFFFQVLGFGSRLNDNARNGSLQKSDSRGMQIY
jgi:hypothetical protein